MMISIIPSQKSGAAIAAADVTVTLRSRADCGFVPAISPSGSPMRIVTTSAPNAMLNVTGNRWAISVRTCSVCRYHELPMSPCRIPESQCQYWAKNPRSR